MNKRIVYLLAFSMVLILTSSTLKVRARDGIQELEGFSPVGSHSQNIMEVRGGPILTDSTWSDTFQDDVGFSLFLCSGDRDRVQRGQSDSKSRCCYVF